MPELAEKAGLSSEDLAAVKTVTENLMDAFGKLDDSLHGGEPANVDEISDVISEQFTRLQAVL